MALPDYLKISYGSWAGLTLAAASLASDANLLAGRESTVIDNTTNLFEDVRCTGKITTGTTPTTAKTIEIWGYGEWNAASTYPDVLTGSDSNKTITSTDIKNAAMALAAIITTDGTSNRTYPFEIGSIASLWGFMPQRWGLFVVHDTGSALNATGSNHSFNYIGKHGQIADT